MLADAQNPLILFSEALAERARLAWPLVAGLEYHLNRGVHRVRSMSAAQRSSIGSI